MRKLHIAGLSAAVVAAWVVTAATGAATQATHTSCQETSRAAVTVTGCYNLSEMRRPRRPAHQAQGQPAMAVGTGDEFVLTNVTLRGSGGTSAATGATGATDRVRASRDLGAPRRRWDRAAQVGSVYDLRRQGSRFEAATSGSGSKSRGASRLLRPATPSERRRHRTTSDCGELGGGSADRRPLPKQQHPQRGGRHETADHRVVPCVGISRAARTQSRSR